MRYLQLIVPSFIRFLVTTILGVVFYLPIAAVAFLTIILLFSTEPFLLHQVVPMMREHVYGVISLSFGFVLVRGSFLSSSSASHRSESMAPDDSKSSAVESPSGMGEKTTTQHG